MAKHCFFCSREEVEEERVEEFSSFPQIEMGD